MNSSSRDWFRVARVRRGERPRVRPGDTGAAFTLQPHMIHPRVQALGPDARAVLLRRALGRYLHATTVLELRHVNPVAAAIAHGEAPVRFADPVRLDAHKLYCDEAYHALLAADLLFQLDPTTSDREAPAFEARLAGLGGRDGPLIDLLFVVVSETVLSDSLRTLSRDPHVLPAVRAFVSEHAHDEAWHAAFFAARFAELWPQLAPADRDRVGALLPDLLHAFLAPDVEAVARDLEAVGLEPSAIVDEALPPEVVAEIVRRGARPALGALAPALRGPTLDAFVAAGLVT